MKCFDELNRLEDAFADRSHHFVSVLHRDASFGTCMYNLDILDCLRGVDKVWK